jgi:hypothetical protein
MARAQTTDIATRIAALDWDALGDVILEHGHAVTDPLLSAAECSDLKALFDDDALFRKRIDMARYNYGRGHYAYFANPLPPLVGAVREALYRHLAPIANAMMQALGEELRYPPKLAAFRKRCAEAGQSRPTPLLLRYGAGDFNCLHRDLYGPLAFPLQAVALLDEPGRDFTGGEFLLVENRARQQSRGQVVPMPRGGFVLFAGDLRPAQGRRGITRAHLRHGVSPVLRGQRTTLGIIFHDAR